MGEMGGKRGLELMVVGWVGQWMGHFESSYQYITLAPPYYHYNSQQQSMADDSETQDFHSSKTSVTLHSSSSKSDIDVIKDRKKKMAAFQTFLEVKTEPFHLEDLPRRNMSNSQVEQQPKENDNVCLICKEYLTSQARLCEFCKETVCHTHFRKRRRNNNTNKWTRICQHCEDKYLMEKHYQSQLKSEESLMTQEVILNNRFKELKQLLQSKKEKLHAQIKKKIQIGQIHNKNMAECEKNNLQLDKKQKSLEMAYRQNGNLQLSLMSLEMKMPSSLQTDFEFLQSQDSRITKDLIRYEKLCVDAVKSRSQREKDMYKEYYQWQQQKRREIQTVQRKEEECQIY